MAGYRKYIELQPEELTRLIHAIKLRPLIFDTWAFCTGRKGLPEVAAGMAKTQEISKAIASRAVRAFGSDFARGE